MIIKIIIASTFLLFSPVACMELTPPNNSTPSQQTTITDIKAEWPPIFVAIFNQNKHDVKQLITQGTDVNERSGFSKKTPLHEAVLFSYDITKTLLKHGANVNALDNYGKTPLHNCMNFFNTNKTIELLLQHKTNVNMQDHDGETALHKAVKLGDIKKIHLLLVSNANVSITTNKGKTALDYAQENDSTNEHIQLIIAALKNELNS